MRENSKSMEPTMPRARLAVAIAAAFVLGALATPVAAQQSPGAAASGTEGQVMSAEDIAKALQPRPRTRSASGGLKPDEVELLRSLSTKPVTTRGFGRSDRDKIQGMVAEKKLSKVDFTITFDLNSAEIRPEAFPVLANLAQALKMEQFANVNFLVGGHTDARGTDAYNLALSLARANAVRTYLIEHHGLDERRLQPIGYGQGHPKIKEDPMADENRRVEIVSVPTS